MSSHTDALLLHGWGTHSGIWQRVRDELDVDTKVLDLPGYGQASHMLFPENLDKLVENLLDRAPQRAVWVGWSLGGMAAIRAAVLAPERVKALFLVCSTPKFVKSQDWQWGTDINLFKSFVEGLNQDYKKNLRRFLLLQAGDNKLARQISRPIAEIIEGAPQPSSKTLLNGLNILKQTDLRQQISQLKIPIYLFSGELDRICHPKASEWMAEQTHGQQKSIRCGHCPQLSHPKELAKQLTTILEEVAE